jgi:hypothetical protein
MPTHTQVQTFQCLLLGDVDHTGNVQGRPGSAAAAHPSLPLPNVWYTQHGRLHNVFKDIASRRSLTETPVLSSDSFSAPLRTDDA